MVSFVVAAVHYLFYKVSPVPLYNIYLPKSDNQIKDKIFNSLFNFCQLAITEMSPCHIDTENESCLEPYQESTILQMLQLFKSNLLPRYSTEVSPCLVSVKLKEYIYF